MRNCARTIPRLACRTYAPVGSHRDLLAYLVRRLLENGANSSFVALAADDAVPVAHCCGARPTSSAQPANARHPNIPLPAISTSRSGKIRAASNSATARR